MVQSGVPLEGNLFTEHFQPEIPAVPIEAFRNKRSNYALFCAAGSSLLEIGFNAGHSCMLALSANKDLVYTGVDIGMHAYTQPCFEYLRSYSASASTCTSAIRERCCQRYVARAHLRHLPS